MNATSSFGLENSIYQKICSKSVSSYLNRSSSGAYRWSNRQEVEISRTVQSSCRAQSIFSIQHTVEWKNYLLRTNRNKDVQKIFFLKIKLQRSKCFIQKERKKKKEACREMKPSSNRDMKNIKITARNFYFISWRSN
ncbi:hypothetical protein BgiBS90_018420 [Biomphalaria glabrata]|nr:hypothetical protein BgiBS90_018420 [Biomphalaria glabrata]